MKILFLASASSIHSYKWISFFSKRGHEITWIALDDSQFDLSGMRFIRAKNLLIGIMLARKLVSEGAFDIVHAHYLGKYGLIGAVLNFERLVLTAWGSDILINRYNIVKRLILKYILKKAKLVTTDAEHMIAAIKNMGVSAELLRRINFGVDTSKLIPSQRKMYKKTFTIISTRRLEPIYDVETLLRAIPLIKNEILDFIVIVVGGGVLEASLKHLAKELKIEEFVLFTGSLPNEKLLETLKSADVYVSTSLSDAGIAASTAEAMSLELPVVITDSGENNLWINHGENGFLFHVKDSEALAKHLVVLSKDVALREKIAHEGRNVIIKRNDYEWEMRKMEQLYCEVIS